MKRTFLSLLHAAYTSRGKAELTLLDFKTEKIVRGSLIIKVPDQSYAFYLGNMGMKAGVISAYLVDEV